MNPNVGSFRRSIKLKTNKQKTLSRLIRIKLINHIRNDRGDTLQILEILEIMRERLL